MALSCKESYCLVLSRGAEGRPVHLSFSRRALWAALVAGILFLAAFIFLASKVFMVPTGVASLKQDYQERLQGLRDKRQALREDIQRFQDTRKGMQAALESLGRQVGTMQARVTRLDSLGERVVQVAGLTEGEFDFSRSPAVGGPEDADRAAGFAGKDLSELAQQIERLAARISDREDQLELLQGMIDRRAVRQRMRPDGWPTGGGWLSSDFGRRVDPFTGHPARHYGVDIANKEGAEVKAIAPGVVTWAGDRYGYGKLVEIDHGNGYRTRYGHNKQIEVEVGERVSKNAVVGAVGDTGRSTGPHIHLEVLHNGQKIDPRKFLDR